MFTVSSFLLITILSASQTPALATPIISLDGQWQLATDPENTGITEQWFTAPRPEAQPTRVPWIIQDTFPGYHGLAWYWRDIEVPQNPNPNGRYILRFWAVDYKADVWVNNQHAGTHEGPESCFTFDVTALIQPNATNHIAVRVLNPTDSPIDGIILGETPHRNKVCKYWAGATYNHGGIVDSVELLLTPSVRIADVFARPDAKTGDIHIEAAVINPGETAINGQLGCSATPGEGGAVLAAIGNEQTFAPGTNIVTQTLHIDNPCLWDIKTPHLYQVNVTIAGNGFTDLFTVRCGFRDFRFENGAFHLNGKRIYLRSSHTGNSAPIGLQFPYDPDILRQDLINCKTMGFNAIRFISGVSMRDQLDLCDELGLMVYEEPYAGWCLGNSPKMAERFDESVIGMILRDRNHPSLVMWGLLNETPDGPVFQHALASLPTVRKFDTSRIVMLNSGRWDRQGKETNGIESWNIAPGMPDPNVTRNPKTTAITPNWARWEPGQCALHPGVKDEYSAIRWTAPSDATYHIAALFKSIATKATTSVAILHNTTQVFLGGINLPGAGPEAPWEGDITCATGDTLDFVVGVGTGGYGGDTTGLTLTITAPNASYDLSKDFRINANPNGPWTYGFMPPAENPDPAQFTPYGIGQTVGGENNGTLSNPGSNVWEDVLNDQHQYPRVPHRLDVINFLRNLEGGGQPVFLSEYGIGSAVDLIRAARHYEQRGKTGVEDAQFYRNILDSFMADWNKWDMAACFGRPEDYFNDCLSKMAGQRLLGLNAIRSNPNIIGYSLTGTVDQGMTGEGLLTTFREHKPGTIDAMFDGWAPLRLCLFAEPPNVRAGAQVHLEAVLADEDVLAPGEYPVRLIVQNADRQPVYEKVISVAITGKPGSPDRPMVRPIFDETITLNAPEGQYRFLAAFDQGGAAAGGEAKFQVFEPYTTPLTGQTLTLWDESQALADWLITQGASIRRFSADDEAQTILIVKPANPDPGLFQALATQINNGASCVIFDPAAFLEAKPPVELFPALEGAQVKQATNWVYLKDEWAKKHPVFNGLQAGGLLDYGIYRDIIPDAIWQSPAAPREAIAGANNTSQNYTSGLIAATYSQGQGKIMITTLRMLDLIGTDPVAERLITNIVLYAATSK